MSTSQGPPIERPELKKVIGGFGFFSIAFGSMIGVAWITALGGWFEQAGPVGSMLAFAAGGRRRWSSFNRIRPADAQ